MVINYTLGDLACAVYPWIIGRKMNRKFVSQTRSKPGSIHNEVPVKIQSYSGIFTSYIKGETNRLHSRSHWDTSCLKFLTSPFFLVVRRGSAVACATCKGEIAGWIAGWAEFAVALYP